MPPPIGSQRRRQQRSSSRSSTGTATCARRLRRALSPTGVAAAPVGFGSLFDQDDFFRDAGQIGYNLTLVGPRHASQHPRRLPAVHRLRRSDPQLERLGHHHRAGAARSASSGPPARRSSTRRPSSSRRRACVPDDSLRVPLAEHRVQRHDQLARTGRSTSACWPATTRCTARDCERLVGTLSGFVKATGPPPTRRRYKMYEIPFSKMIQPRLSATWAYNGKDTVFASYAQLQPGGQLAAARGVVGSQPRDHDQRLLRRERQPVRRRPGGLVVRQAVRARHDAARRYDEFLVGTARQFSTALSGARLLPLPQGHALLGGHATNHVPRCCYAPPANVPGTDVSIPRDARTSRT